MTVTALVGIVSWNTAGLLDSCLASLPAATEGLACRVVVHDNASSDGSADVARAHPGVEVRQAATNEGYARAMNAALAPAAGPPGPDVLIALNPDTVCPPGSLRSLCDALLAEGDVGLVAPVLRYPNGAYQPSAYRFPSPLVSMAASFAPLRLQRGRLGRRLGLEAAPPPDTPVDIDWATGAVHVIRAAALGGRPPYDERWFMYTEDLDLCWRLAARGWRRRLVPDVSVTHVANAAGHQAWGPARTERWLAAAYDWYGLRHGRGAARRWAAANCAGAAFRLALLRWRRARRAPIEAWEEALAPALAVHRRAVLSPPQVSGPDRWPG